MVSLANGISITRKRGVVWLMDPICMDNYRVSKMFHSTPLTKINNVVVDGHLFLSRTALLIH